jgi:hypothetical protein
MEQERLKEISQAVAKHLWTDSILDEIDYQLEPTERISADDIATMRVMITHELMTKLPIRDRRVVIEVEGGVASLDVAPDCVWVSIIDRDVEEEDDSDLICEDCGEDLAMCSCEGDHE